MYDTTCDAGRDRLGGVRDRSGQVLAPLPGLDGDAGLAGLATLWTLTGLAGDWTLSSAIDGGGATGLGALTTLVTGLAGLATLWTLGALATLVTGLAGLATLWTLAVLGDAGESASLVEGALTGGSLLVGGPDSGTLSTGVVTRTEAADASCAAVVGTTTGADRRGTLVVTSSMITPFGVSVTPSGAASTKPPTATPVIVPIVAATFQLSLFGLGIMSFS